MKECSMFARRLLAGGVLTSLTALLAGCSSDTNADRSGSGDAELGTVAQALTLGGGIRILSDRDASYALNAYGGATEGGPVLLWQNCTTSNPDCRWIYQRGMLVSANDSSLAITVDGSTPPHLVLTSGCQPEEPTCTWTWSQGQLLNDATKQGIEALLSPPNPFGSPVQATDGCGESNSAAKNDVDCTWTLESAPIHSRSDLRLGVTAELGATPGSPLWLQGCPVTNPQCTWTFSKGMIYSDADPTLQINAYGGATAGTLLRLYSGCSPSTPDCTWTVKGGWLQSDSTYLGPSGPTPLVVSNAGGPWATNELRLAPLEGEAPALRECRDGTPSAPACSEGYSCHMRSSDTGDDDEARDRGAPDVCIAECSWGNSNCQYDVAPPAPVEWTGSPAPVADWTYMIVIMADGDFSYQALEDLDRMAEAGSSDDVNIIAFLDTPDWYNTNHSGQGNTAGTHVPLYGGSGMYLRINRNAPPTVLADLGDVVQTSPDSLADFGTFAAEYFPAQRYSLLFWDHGSGWGGFGQDASAPTDPRSVSIPNGDYATALTEITGPSGTGKPLELVGFDACLMGNWEVGLASSPFAKYMVASQESMPGSHTYDYSALLQELVAAPTMSGLDLGTAHVDHYTYSLPQTVSLADLGAGYPTLTAAVDALGIVLQDPSLYDCIEAARVKARGAADRERGTLCDLYWLADNLANDCGVSEAVPVRNAVDAQVLHRNSENAGDPGGTTVYIPPRCDFVDPFYYGTNGASWGNDGIGAVWSQQTHWDEFLRGFAPAHADRDTDDKPFAPTNFTITAASPHHTTFSWTPSLTSGVTYALLRGTTPGEYSTIWTGTDTSHQDVHSSTTQYYYAVAAINCDISVPSTEVPVGPPSVAITSPANGATLATASTITLQASASDAGGSVGRVEFYNGSTRLGTDTTEPYSYTWSNVPAGTYSLTAIAYDNLNIATTSMVTTITVSSATGPCSGLCSPAVTKIGPNIQSGNLGAGAICHQTLSSLAAGNCSNMAGRTLSVNGVTMNCNVWSLPAKRNTGYCIQVSAGGLNYASYATW